MKLLLDSNAYSHLKRGHRRVADLVLGAEEILLPAVVVGELLYGFRKGARFERNIRDMYAFLDHPSVTFAQSSLATADHYARIAIPLRTKGRPIPSNDIWVAAHAMETGADLVSYDRHFDEVDGLAWIYVPTD